MTATSPEVLALMRESFCAIPESLRGCFPPVLCAVRRECATAPGYKAWLVVRAVDPCERYPKGLGLVEWWPRAGAWNCRPRCVWRGEGVGVVAQAWRVAAPLSAEGPPKAYCPKPAGKLTASGEPRDIQRQAVYRWENLKLDAMATPFETEKDAQLFVTACARLVSPHFTVSVQLRPRMRSAWGGTIGIHTSAKAMTPVIMLHELAHVIVERRINHRAHMAGTPKVAAHGPEWLAWYLALVVAVLRPGEWGVLVASAKLAGLKVGECPAELKSIVFEPSRRMAAKKG